MNTPPRSWPHTDSTGALTGDLELIIADPIGLNIHERYTKNFSVGYPSCPTFGKRESRSATLGGKHTVSSHTVPLHFDHNLAAVGETCIVGTIKLEKIAIPANTTSVPTKTGKMKSLS